MRKVARFSAGIAALTIIYVVTARFGLALGAVSGFASLTWAPAGISLAAMLMFGAWLWPAVLIGAFVGNFSSGGPLTASIGIALGNTAAALVAVLAIRALCEFDPKLTRLRAVLALMIVGALFSPVISATVGVSSLWWAGVVDTDAFGATWRTWWLGDFFSDLVLAPVLLTWGSSLRVRRERLLEKYSLNGLMIAAGLLVFSNQIRGMEYLLLPLTIWAVMRFGQKAGTTTSLLVAVIGIIGIFKGYGPFVTDLHGFELFTASLASTSLILGGVLGEKEYAYSVENRRRQFVAGATELLATTTDSRAAWQALVWRAVPEFADWCVVHALLPDGSIRMEAVAHIDSKKTEVVRDMEERYPYDVDAPVAIGKAIATGVPELVEEIPDDTFNKMARSDGHLSILRELGLASYIIVPVAVAGNVRATLSFATEGIRRFNRDDLGVAVQLAHSMAIAMERARLYEAETEARQVAEAAVRSRDAFISIAAHELRTPLGVLALQAEILKRNDLVSSRLTEAAPEKVADQVRRLTKLVENLLDRSRITAGKLHLELTDVDLSQVVRGVVARFDGELKKARCDVTIVDHGPLVGHWDAMRIEQIITNLLSNAWKYGAGAPILIGIEGDAELARLTVRDHGCGIEPAEQERIFEPFERTQNAMVTRGLGLGLWIVRQIVEALGGKISVRSEGGGGSLFTVTLPRRTASLVRDNDRAAGGVGHRLGHAP